MDRLPVREAPSKEGPRVPCSQPWPCVSCLHSNVCCPSTQTLEVSRLVLWKGEGGWAASRMPLYTHPPN